MGSLDHFFGDVMAQVDELVADAKAIVDKHAKWEAKVGWEIADGEFSWDLEKKFSKRFDAQQWMNAMMKTGNYDAGEVSAR